MHQGPGHPGQNSSVPQTHTPALDETWRNVGYDEAVESSKRQLSHAVSNAFTRSPLPEKRPRTDGAFNGDSLLFKSTLEGKQFCLLYCRLIPYEDNMHIKNVLNTNIQEVAHSLFLSLVPCRRVQLKEFFWQINERESVFQRKLILESNCVSHGIANKI